MKNVAKWFFIMLAIMLAIVGFAMSLVYLIGLEPTHIELIALIPPIWSATFAFTMRKTEATKENIKKYLF